MITWQEARRAIRQDWCCYPNAVGVSWWRCRRAWLCLADAVLRCKVKAICDAHSRQVEGQWQ